MNTKTKIAAAMIAAFVNCTWLQRCLLHSCTQTVRSHSSATLLVHCCCLCLL